MTQNIQDNLVKLLDAYLEDLKTEADTVTHIVNYINDSTAARAALAEQLEAYFWTRQKKPGASDLSSTGRDTAQIQGKAEALLKGLSDFNMSQPESSKGM
ncbi:MAG: hypothetical protein KKB37_13930 [Alphaproteobacteria bacterium]|nr:hypothetical protein [Alphaproteobacteria bacterium]